MDYSEKNKIIDTVLEREGLRKLSRIQRLIKSPARTLPFYIIAALTRLGSFKMSFKTLWGDNMTCYMPEGNTFLYYGYCEANLTNFLIKNIKPGQVFVDVGAHVGFYTMLCSHLVKESGSIHSFEPTPWTFELLRKNTSNFKNVSLNNCAVSDKDGNLEFLDYGPGFGAYNTTDKDGAPALSKKASLIKTKVLALDSYLKYKSIKPDFIKIDAEGAEHHVLKGILETLRISRPIVSIEVAGDDQWKENIDLSFNTLKEADYIACEINIDGTLKPHTQKEHYTYDNLIFMPRERYNG